MRVKYYQVEAFVIMLYQISSCGANVIICKHMVTHRTKCSHVVPNVIMWSYNVIMLNLCYYICVTKCYRGANVIMWNRFYHLKAYVIRGDEM
jgi:hypothetical protein